MVRQIRHRSRRLHNPVILEVPLHGLHADTFAGDVSRMVAAAHRATVAQVCLKQRLEESPAVRDF
jgi:hypothetical protein